MAKTFRCLAERRDGVWEAICLDLDVAVHGESYQQVYERLRDAIVEYCATVNSLSADERARFVPGRVPLGIWLKFYLAALRDLFAVSPQDADKSRRHGFIMPPGAIPV